jgi:uncharacterized protein (TIGR02246 family)
MLRPLHLPFVASLAIILAAGCAEQPAQKPAAPPDTRKADEAAIRTASSDWNKAFQAKDLDKVMSYYTDDAIYFVDNGAMVKTKDTIRAAWEPVLKTPGPGLSFATDYVEVARSGDLAYEYGTYDNATEARKGKVTHEKGKYVVVWKKQADGSWKAAIDIGNPGE